MDWNILNLQLFLIELKSSNQRQCERETEMTTIIIDINVDNKTELMPEISFQAKQRSTCFVFGT